MIWHSSEKDSVLGFFSTDKDKGLSDQSAQEIYKSSISETKQGPSFFKIFLKQFNSYLFIFMTISAVLSALLSFTFDNNAWISTIIIVLIMIIDGLWNCMQEYSAKKAMVDVEGLTAATANVLRDGIVKQIPAQELIPGDIIVLGVGDYIPADCRLIEVQGLRCDEYPITGEVVFVEKDCDFICEDITEISERSNMVFAGCTVMSGSAKAVVTETGPATEIAKMKSLIKKSDTDVAMLGSSVKALYKIASATVITVGILYFLISILFNNSNLQSGFAGIVVDSLKNCMALIVAVLPATLPAIITVILGRGIKKLSNDGIIIRKPSSIEKCANISLICADKTSTLTNDNMSVVKLFDGNSITDIDAPLSSPALMLLKLGMICGNGIDYNENSSRVIKDSTDTAIANACYHYTGISESEAINTYPLLGSVEFDNERKLITTINMINGKPFVICKGAPEKMAEICTNYPADKLISATEEMAAQALRVIAVAYKQIDEVPAIPMAAELENNLNFVGLIGLYDEPNAGTVAMIESAEKAGIRTVMLTGDNLTTATAVARRIGIFHDGMKAITGDELKAMSDEELDREIINYSVFARILPEDRYRILRAFQRNNETVAIAGSNIDDAPMLNKADVGIALDEVSTDVARRASDAVVKNSSIETAFKLISSGKILFANIKRVIRYLLSCNLAELIVVFFGMLIFHIPVFTAVQLLLIGFITDALPTLSIGTVSYSKPVIKRNFKTDKLFTVRSVISIAIQSVTLAVITLMAFNIGNKHGALVGSTMAFAVLGFSQIVHAISCCSNRSIFKTDIWKNPKLFISLGISVALMIIALFTPVCNLFTIAKIQNADLWLNIFVFVAIFFIVDELIKLGFYIYEKVKR